MSLREFVTHEVEALGESDLQAVAEFVSFLKFRSRTTLSDSSLASLYQEFDKEDRELYSARPGLRDVLFSEPQGASRGLCILSAPAASALPLTKPQI